MSTEQEYDAAADMMDEAADGPDTPSGPGPYPGVSYSGGAEQQQQNISLSSPATTGPGPSLEGTSAGPSTRVPVSSRSKSRSKPTVERRNGVKSKLVLISKSSKRSDLGTRSAGKVGSQRPLCPAGPEHGARHR